jgi:hypothetical protein
MKAVYSRLEDPERSRRRQTDEIMRLRGDNRKPDPPRDLIAQAGSRSALITWKAPILAERVAEYRIYSPTETDLVGTTKANNYTLPLSSGSSPSSQAVYVSCVSLGQLESNKVQAIAVATAETGAPAQPAPPPESGASATASSEQTDVIGRKVHVPVSDSSIL